MATRKSRQNTDSPTPSGTESVPTTPTTPATRNTRMLRNKQLQQGKTDETPIQIKSEKIDEDEEAVKDTNNEDESNDATVTVATITAATTTTTIATTTTTTAATRESTSTPTPEKVDIKSESADQNDKEKEISPPSVSTRKRRIAAAKEDSATEKSATTNETVNTNATDTGKTSPTKITRSRRSAFELLTDGRPDLPPSILSKRRNSTGKIDKPTRKLSSRIKKLKQLRKTPLRAMLKKPDKTLVAVNKPIKQLIEKQTTTPTPTTTTTTTSTTKATKVEKSDSASDSELIKMSRRRSDSISKCSDMTDASSFQETKDSVDDLLAPTSETTDSKLLVKVEDGEKDETVEIKTPENDLIETARSANDSGIGGDSDNSQAVKPDNEQNNDGKRSSRFSRRKRPLNPMRVMNTRSRSETPSKANNDGHDDDDDGTIPAKEMKKENVDGPLQIDTTVSDVNTDVKMSPEIEHTDKENVCDEKAKSLSPVLVSEGVSEISVKQFYGRADFLENNLGIEKDPKLGEIVQIQENFKTGDGNENGDKIDDSNNKSVAEQLEDCAKPSDDVTVSINANANIQVDTSSESMDVDESNDVEMNDGAKCDVLDTNDTVDCFVKPAEIIRRDSATILNENLLVLNGEIELMSTKEKKDMTKCIDEDVGEVVLYTISNGKRGNPEKLEKVLESQKLKEKERSSSIESGGDVQITNEIDDSEKIEIESETIDCSIPVKKEDDVTKTNTKCDELVCENIVKAATVRSSSASKDSRSSSLDDESPEEKIQKESHLKTLGLLTHQAAEEATIEKQKQREKIKASKGKKNSEYTGTLKTVIKLHRGNDKKKGNQSLKMTLHKGRAKNGSDKSDSHSTANSEEDTYYTIQQQDDDGIDHEADEAAAKEHEKLLVIPEKASSFRYHPEKICEDQCFYCGGKFGLFDTPCHIAQIKSAERQKKILEYEEKLTVDSCLCDACFRHVDRRANCPSYKKRLSEPSKNNETNTSRDDTDDKESESLLFQDNKEVTFCQVHDCKEQASHSMCRKWALKIRKTLNKHIHLNLDHTAAMAFLPICDKHYENINHMLICMLCNRRLKRNRSYFLSQDANKVESLILNEGIHVNVGTTSVACKLCRYYINLLMRPQDAKKTDFLRDYRKRILEYHGKVDLVEDDSEDSASPNEPASKRPKRNRRSLNDQSKSSDLSIDQEFNTSTRTRQKNKQMTQQQLLEEQQRVEKRVQQEQLKLKQQEILQQHQQKLQDELRQQQLRSSNEDISNLRTNPNISMRELFPGEEEMGLHVNLPFANSWRTPDGWTKVTSTVQYDEPTKRLWEELQKPYGNQSSFLRHLLLLEKYFRNGDLLLTPNAHQNSITYAESVQHRLQAFDNIPPRAVSISQILPLNNSTQSVAMDLASGKTITTANKAVTISKVNAPPKPPPALSITPNPKPVTSDGASNNSLLKSNVTFTPKVRSHTVTNESINGDKTDTTKTNNSVANSNVINTSTPKTKNPGLPPELICITTPANDKHATGVPPPSYQLQMQLTLQQQIQQQHQNSLLLSQQTKQLLQNMVQPAMVPPAPTNPVSSPKKSQTSVTQTNTPNANKSPTNNPNSTSTGKGNVIRLPDALTEAERLNCKNWRPTLMPITSDKNNTDGQMYQTADGRRLPYLVQVQSGGKPYMISIHDYNRMCILRRERLLKDQTEILKNKINQSGATSQTTSTVSQKQTNTTTTTTTAPLTSSNTTLNNINTKSNPSIDVDKVSKSQTNPNNGPISSKVPVSSKFLEHNTIIPINSKSNENSTSSDSLLRFRFSKNKSSLLKSNAANHTKSVSTQHLIAPNPSVTATVVAPKLPITLPPALTQSNVVSITSTPSISAILGMTQASTPPPMQLIPNQTQPITITNVTSGMANNTVNQSNVSSLEALFRTTNQVTTTPTTMWQWAEQLSKSSSIAPLPDNSATSILSKIPKSLTVIPQQKNMSKGTDE